MAAAFPVVAEAVLVGGAALAATLALRNCSAKLCEFINAHIAAWEEAETSKDTREPTPAVSRGVRFEQKRIANKTVYQRQTDGDYFLEDLSHYNSNPAKSKPHYEVYRSDKDLEKGKRHRSVTWDGKLMQKFP